ncbi:MAG: hypothetical protein M3Z02_12390 [Actinomycetota bacterium]|nr:hypothetical protein [Actinomycetota bacterium]
MTGKLKQMTVLTVVAVLAIGALGWFLLIAPKNKQADQLHAQALAQKDKNTTLRNQLAILQAQGKNLVAQQARLADIATRVPDNPGLPSLIRGLSDAADQAGVDLVTIAPSAPAPVAVTAGVVAAPAAPASAPAAPAAQLAEIPVVLTISGGFFPVEQFISNLEGLSRSYLVTGMTAAPGAGSAGAATTKPKVGQQLQVTINGKVFMSASVATPAVAAVVPAPAAPTK